MGYTKIWVHLVWATKRREPLLTKNEIRQKVFDHIKENARVKNIYVDCVNGYIDHIHVLVSFWQNKQSLKWYSLSKVKAHIGSIKII